MGQNDKAKVSQSPKRIMTSGEQFNTDIDIPILGDFLDVPLIRLNIDVISKSHIGSTIHLQNYEQGCGVFTENGRLGDIPLNYLKVIEKRDLRKGFVLDFKLVPPKAQVRLTG